MKPDINLILNKLVAYAEEYLLLDTLDEVYTLNKLATLCGVSAPELTETDVDGIDIDGLLSELKAAVPGVDTDAALDMLMPAPHTVDYYFSDQLSRNADKAFGFLFDLFEHGACVNPGAARECEGYIYYPACPQTQLKRAVLLDVGEQLPYTPLVCGNRIAAMPCEDILSSDVIAKMGAFASAYGGAIAKRVPGDGDYMCCSDMAVAKAKPKKQLKDGAVKAHLLDYPVPALALSGIAKNAVEREAARVIKDAAEGGLSCVVACKADKTGSPVFYIIFAGDVKEDDVLKSPDALAACGVFATVDLAPLLPVLEKGTALSSDLFAYKAIYAGIGGVKHGAKAAAVLDGAVVKQYKAALAAAASATEEQAIALADGSK